MIRLLCAANIGAPTPSSPTMTSAIPSASVSTPAGEPDRGSDASPVP